MYKNCASLALVSVLLLAGSVHGDLVISSINRPSYTVQYDSLAVGQLVYIDRAYTFSSVPSSLQSKTYIKTANGDKAATGDSFLTFNVNEGCTVYVAHCDLITTKPSWMSTFTDTGEDIRNNGSTGSFSVYAKSFGAGTVTLGGNAGGNESMYSVVVAGILPPSTKAILPSPTNGASGVGIDDNLSWTAGVSAVSHDVYFGTSQAAVAAASRLAGDVNGSGSVDISDVAVLAQQWLGVPTEPYADLDGDDDVDMADFSVISADWLDSADSVYKGNQTGTTFDPGTLGENTDYYWRIDEINSSEPGSPWTGDVWSFTTRVAVGRQTLIEPVTGRRYILYVPTDYNPVHSYPLVISSHGTYQNGDTEMDSTGPYSTFDNGTPTWPTLAEDNDVIVACPDMIGAHGPCSPDATQLAALASDDTVIINIILEIESIYTIDSGAILLTGFSGGGHVVHYTGLRHPDVFRATCARHGNFGSAEVPSPLPGGATDMPVYIFTGSSDPTCGPSESITWYTAQGFNLLDTEIFTTYPSNTHTTDRHHALNWFFEAMKPRVIVSTDLSPTGDPDDYQSMVHYLTYADRFDTEGLLSSPPCNGRAADILAVINAYETDYSNLDSHADFPTPQSLRDVTKQGAISVAPSAGYSTATTGSNWIISRANVSDARPLWVLVWGSITDVAQAVHDNPSIKGKIRVCSTGGWNTLMDPYARNYLFNNHSDLWWIENDSTCFGVFIGGNQSGDLGNTEFVAQHVRYHGALGDLYYSRRTELKMGDSSLVFYMLNGVQDDPTAPHWGGMFWADGHGSHYWTDLTDPQYEDVMYYTYRTYGAKTVSIWREAYLRDWQTRMDWADGQ